MPVDPGIAITPEYAARMRKAGLWKDEMLIDFLAKHAAELPTKAAADGASGAAAPQPQ